MPTMVSDVVVIADTLSLFLYDWEPWCVVLANTERVLVGADRGMLSVLRTKQR